MYNLQEDTDTPKKKNKQEILENISNDVLDLKKIFNYNNVGKEEFIDFFKLLENFKSEYGKSQDFEDSNKKLEKLFLKKIEKLTNTFQNLMRDKE